MRVSIQLSDELHDCYMAMVKPAGVRNVADVITEQLKRFAAVSPADRVLVIPAKERDQLEQILSGGHLKSAQDLVEKVGKLAAIDISGVKLRFTPGQKAELKRVAARQGVSYDEMVRRTVSRMEELFFNHV